MTRTASTGSPAWQKTSSPSTPQAARGEDELRPVISEWSDEAKNITPAEMAIDLRPVLAAREEAALTDEFVEDQVIAVREGFRAGADGCIDDHLAFTRP